MSSVTSWSPRPTPARWKPLPPSRNTLPEVDPRGFEYHWLRFARAPRENAPDSETAVVGSGRVSVTPLQFERTDERTFAALEAGLRKG